MKILDHGTNDTKVFVCNRCGCRFEAAPDEYWTGNSITINAIGEVHKTCCPECHKVCTSYDAGYCCCN